MTYTGKKTTDSKKKTLASEDGAECSRAGTLRGRQDDLKREMEIQNRNLKRLDDNIRGKIISLDEMLVMKRGEVETARSKFERSVDKNEYQKKRNLKFVDISKEQMEETTASFEEMRRAMVNNFNKTIEKMNQEYERRKDELFRMTTESKEKLTQEQYEAAQHLEMLFDKKKKE